MSEEYQACHEWWLVVRSPDQVWCWPVDDCLLDADLVNAARVATGFPDNENWVTDKSGWDIAIGGRPHDDVLGIAIIGAVKDLRAVNRTAVAEHADARAANAHEAKVADLAELLAGVDPVVLAQALAHPQVAASIAAATEVDDGPLD